MDQEGKHNIFARPTSQGAGKRVRIGVSKAKGQSDDVVEAGPRSNDDSIDDGFNSYQLNSSKKFDLSSKTVNEASRVNTGNDTIRHLTSMRASVRAIDDAV
jgi:hypothetical protein